MQAWRVHARGEPPEVFRLEAASEPTAEALARLCVDLAGLRPLQGEMDRPVADWVILAVRAAALGLPDVTMARGSYPVPITRPYTAGLEACGVVEEASPSMQAWLGRRVVAFTPQPFGALAPRAVGIKSALFPVPEGMGDVAAAAFLLASHTAWHGLRRRGGLQAGETALILGAAGGLGSAAIQIAKASGARVIAVAGGAERAAFRTELGADVAIDHLAGDFVAAVLDATGWQPLDLIFDPVQGEAGERARPLLRPEGRHVLCGHAGGLRPIDPSSFYMQNYTLVGATMGAYPPPQGEQIEADAHAGLLALLAEGSFRPVVGRQVPFAEAAEALAELAARRTVGRIVVRVAPSDG